MIRWVSLQACMTYSADLYSSTILESKVLTHEGMLPAELHTIKGKGYFRECGVEIWLLKSEAIIKNNACIMSRY